MNLELVEKTWAEVGHFIRPLRRMVFVKTELRPQKSGQVWLPPSTATNYAGIAAHQVLMEATVLSVGPKCRLQPGEKICFARLFFAWLYKLEDGTLVGWIDEENVSGYVEEPEAQAAE